MNSKIVTIAILALLWFGCVATVTAEENEYAGIVPPAEYFTTDNMTLNGHPATSEGLQLGHVWYFTEEARYRCFSGNNYLGITEYELAISHNEQEWVRFGQMFYQCSEPDYPYEGPSFGSVKLSEVPSESVYVSPAEQHAGKI